MAIKLDKTKIIPSATEDEDAEKIHRAEEALPETGDEPTIKDRPKGTATG